MGAALVGETTAPELHVMTLNVRRRVPHLRRRHPDRWDVRAPRLAALLRTERPALLAVQEALPDQAEFVRDALGHDAIGTGRAKLGGDEGCQLFFDPQRLELLDWRQSALSTRPEVAGTRSWGSAFPRILVQAEFRDRTTSTRFLALNTHLDVASTRARRNSARIIRGIVEQRGLPAIVTGDLNAGDRSATVRELTTRGALADAWAAAGDGSPRRGGPTPATGAPVPGRGSTGSWCRRRCA